MSRAPTQRSLTLTEELEKLEQSITLTLQEIDGNFSKAHRIVTSSILPIVEEYAKHSNEVWEGSKFWKQFFEASANVSLSGYEEVNHDEEITETDHSESLHTPTDNNESGSTLTELALNDNAQEDYTVESPSQVTGVQLTPKLAASGSRRPDSAASRNTVRTAASFRSPSPRKYTGSNPRALASSSRGPSTPRTTSGGDPGSSPFETESAFRPSTYRNNNNPNNDPLMHRVLDKSYRIQATPLTQRSHRPASTTRPTPATATKKALWEDSPQSSPEISAPQLRSDLFSPAVGVRAATTGPRTPGVSVLTPAARKTTGPVAAPTTSTGRRLFSPEDKAWEETRERTSHRLFDEFDSDDDHDPNDTSDFLAGISPPKTIQFHVPQSRLVQTPAREASRRIVEDLLLTAGAEDTDEIEAGGEADGDEYGYDEHGRHDVEDPTSPSIVRRAFDVDEETF